LLYILSKVATVASHSISYSPVELFGGEEGFVKNQERDQRKREVAAQNGVQLLEWPYTREVTQKELDAFWIENGF